MSIAHSQRRIVQRLLAAAGYYNGAIDGYYGIKSKGAVETLLKNRSNELPSTASRWGIDRRAMAAAQLILKYAGYEPGGIDGLWGNLTAGAYLEWEHFVTYGERLVLDRTPETPRTPARPPSSFPKQSQASAFFGTPGPALEARVIDVPIPLPMRIDYSLSQYRRHLRLHERCAESGRLAMEDIVRHYGETQWRKLGLDRFAGDYVHRNMRGGTSWSQHAYGAAIDFYAGPNGLTTRCPQALFCKDVYAPFFNIWEAHGWTSLGRAIGRDWMHVQALGL